jgi:hypothetical protein
MFQYYIKDLIYEIRQNTYFELDLGMKHIIPKMRFKFEC